MSRANRTRNPHFRRPPPDEGPLLPLLVMALVPAAGLLAMGFWLPADLILPAISVLALAAAALIGIAAFILPALGRPRPVSAWDLAGALTLIGCAAAMLGDIEPVVEFFKPMPERSNARG
ncbi:MAG: hypothetical protein JSR72_05565 [Proteobacteria bacterium]|nr:hypothetical protein [Pseudomonadota bacterium]